MKKLYLLLLFSIGYSAFSQDRITTYNPSTGNVKYSELSAFASSTVVYQTSGTSATLSNVGRYIPQNASLTVYTLPNTANVGDVIFINGKGAGGWKIAQSTGQQIHAATDTTIGSSGFIASTARYNCVVLVCIVANTEFVLQSSQGSITVN